MTILPSDGEIVKAARDAGWLLEQETARLIETFGFETTLGWPFEDPEEASTSREVDINGFKSLYHDEDAGIMVLARLLVECKQTANPYLAIGRDRSDRERGVAPAEHIFPYSVVAKVHERKDGTLAPTGMVSVWKYLGLDIASGSPPWILFGPRS